MALGAPRPGKAQTSLFIKFVWQFFVLSLIARPVVAEGVVDPAAPSSSEGRRLCPSKPEGSDEATRELRMLY